MHQHLLLGQDENSFLTAFGNYGTEELGTLEYKYMTMAIFTPLARATVTHLQGRRVHVLSVPGISLSKYNNVITCDCKISICLKPCGCSRSHIRVELAQVPRWVFEQKYQPTVKDGL